MAGFVIRAFRGMRPILDPKLLESTEAQEAKDVRLFSGNIEPVKGNETVVALKSGGTVQTIFRARDTADETANWFEFSGDVDVALSPITQDEYGRVYWSGQDVPRYAPTTSAFAAGSGAYPRNSFQLGIPKPTTAANAVGTSVTDPERSDRTYVVTFTNSDGSKESGISSSTTVKSLVDPVDQGVVVTSSFTSESATSYVIETSEPHNLIEDDYIGITGSSVSGWNDSWKVSAVVNEKMFKIENTQTFPGSAPAGSFTVKKRYLAMTKLFALPTESIGNYDATHKKIYRKVSGTYRLVTTLSLEASEYEDIATDTELASATAINSGVLNRPYRPQIAPAPLVPFDDTTITDNPSATVVNRLYAISFVSGNDSEGPLSKASGVVRVIDGTTKVRIAHTETTPTDVLKKRIYRQNVTYTSGTYNLQESAFRLVAEIPVSQDVYIDELAQSSISSNAAPTVQGGLDEPKSAFGVSATLPPKVIPESRVYVYTYVSEYGEEGPPSDPSTLIDIDPNEAVTVTTAAAPNGYSNITKKYIYRTSTGSGETDYQFVGEQAVANTTFTDYKKQADLGEVIPSIDWEPPPTNLFGLRVMANGIFVGFSGKDICFSEPFLPHAWASKNRLPVDHPIVGGGALGQSVAVLTDSFPYIATGVDPSAMTLVKTSLQQACVSKRSIVEVGDAVIYASPDGLVRIGLNGVDVITSKILSQEQWQSYNPSSIHAYIHEGRYYAFYTKADATTGMLVFTLNGADAPLTVGSQHTTAAHVVAKEDSLYIVESGSIKKMDKSTTDKTYTWRSKVFEHPFPINFGVAQVFSPSYGSGVTFKVWADGSLKHTETVTSNAPFRLQSGFIAREWYVQVEGTADITAIAVVQSPTELKGS